MGIVDNIIKAVLSIMPDKRFATLKVEATTAFLVEGIDCNTDFLKAEVLLPTSG
jgi:hypothetical protein